MQAISLFQPKINMVQSSISKTAQPSAQHVQTVLFGREREWILPEDRYGAYLNSAADNNPDVLRDLLEYHKEGLFDLHAGHVNSGGWSPVHLAAGHNSLAWLKVAQEEAKLNLWEKSKNDKAEYPIDVARRGNYPEVVQYLEELKAKGAVNPTKKKRDWKRTVDYSLRQCFLALEKVISWVVAPFKWLYQWIRSMGKSPQP